jgi:hypothetical protein
MITEAPPPGSWDPDIPRDPFLQGWVDGTGHKSPTILRAVNTGQVTTWSASDTDPVGERNFATATMTRHRAVGDAPYVGPPFVYTWFVGVEQDTHRTITSGAHILYRPDPRWPGLYARPVIITEPEWCSRCDTRIRPPAPAYLIGDRKPWIVHRACLTETEREQIDYPDPADDSEGWPRA